MSVQLKAAMRSFGRGKTSLKKFAGGRPDIPFEHFQHFVVAPSSPKQPLKALSQNGNSKVFVSQKFLAPLDDLTNPTSSMKSLQRAMPDAPLGGSPHILQSQLFSYDHKIEKFIFDATDTSYWEATEKLFLKQFDLADVAYWTDLPSVGVLYSPSQTMYTDYNTGIVSEVFRTGNIILTPTPTESPSYDEKVDGTIIQSDCPTIAFPLFNERSKTVGVMVCVRPPGDTMFGEEEEQFVAFFQHKFQVFSRWLLNQSFQVPMIIDILQLHRVEDLIPELTQKMQMFFNCRKCDLYAFDRQKKKMMYFEEGEVKEIQMHDAGIAGFVIENEEIVNIISAIAHPSYSADADGPLNEAYIGVPVLDSSNRFVYATILRGPNNRPLFSIDDEDNLKKISPFIALALSNAYEFSKIQLEYEKSSEQKEGLAALLEVAEILSGQTDTERLCEIIMEKGRYLTKADRCSLFLVSQTRDHLITSFHRGLQKCIDIPITKGIVGRTVTEAKVLNIPDAYEDPNFDNTTDVQTGYRTRSILSVPIFNQRGEVMGVTEMINKTNGTPFTKWDSNLIQIFNVFCGISLENARLYKESKDMTTHLRSFFGISSSFSKTEDSKHIMSEILRNARRALDSRRGTIFIADENSQLFETFIIDGGKMPTTLPIDKGIVGACYHSKEAIICNDAYGDSRFNKTVDKTTGFKTVSLLAVPIIKPNGSCIGVIEVVNRIHGSFRERDMRLLSAISTFIALCFEQSHLKDIAALGTIEVDITKFVAEVERKTYETPAKLKLSDEESNKCISLDFFALDWNGIKLVKLLFNIYRRFNLTEQFKINNETLFHFIYSIRNTYNQVPYHNWVHACDVTEYIAYEISTAKLEQVLTNLEIFALITSAVCHDANHDGFNNIYNLKAETPLGILFKDQSVMETHHCSVAIGIISRTQCNIMSSLSSADYKTMWNWMIKLILATDMAHHFNLVKYTTELLDKKEFSFENDEHRILAMKLLLKTADISNVSRPFSLADKWCDVLCEEFFRQGDNEKKMGIELTSPLNDRENPDKPKSQIGFYNFICIPLYQALARIFPDLEVNANSVKSNLEVWKAMVGSKTE